VLSQVRLEGATATTLRQPLSRQDNKSNNMELPEGDGREPPTDHTLANHTSAPIAKIPDLEHPEATGSRLSTVEVLENRIKHYEAIHQKLDLLREKLLEVAHQETDLMHNQGRQAMHEKIDIDIKEVKQSRDEFLADMDSWRAGMS
jgi:hypothetical protein